jgi:hypothetical protein
MTPSCRFPLRAGGTNLPPSLAKRGARRGAELWLRDWYNKKEGKHNLPPPSHSLTAVRL